MLLKHSFAVPVPAREAWDLLLDVERVVPALPGATLDSFDGDSFTGTVRVKLGAITTSYRGQGRFVERDDMALRAVMEAAGKDTKGGGTAKANSIFAVIDEGDQSRVDVTTDLSITGKPAQFGRGLINDVGAKIIAQFADNLARSLPAKALPSPAAVAAPRQSGASEDLESSPANLAVPQSDPLDLMAVAGRAVAKRVVVGAAVLAVVVGVIILAYRLLA